LLIVLSLMFISFVMGMVSVQQQITQVHVSVDSQLLSALQVYHGQVELFYSGNALCFNRGGHTVSALTGDFLCFYDENYLTKEKK